MNKDDFRQLQDPFPASDIEWRIQSAGHRNGQPWARVIPYITARAVQERLDDVVGVKDWKNEFAPAPGGGVMCGLSIRIDGEWLTKWDGADNTQIEAIKGGLSGAMKRAAVQFGIGRYLYQLPEYFAECFDKPKVGVFYQKFKNNKDDQGIAGSWNPPPLPDFALPHEVLEVRLRTHLQQIAEAESVEQLRKIFESVYRWAKDDIKSVEFAERITAAKNTRKNDLKVQQTKEDQK